MPKNECVILSPYDEVWKEKGRCRKADIRRECVRESEVWRKGNIKNGEEMGGKYEVRKGKKNGLQGNGGIRDSERSEIR